MPELTELKALLAVLDEDDAELERLLKGMLQTERLMLADAAEKLSDMAAKAHAENW